MVLEDRTSNAKPSESAAAALAETSSRFTDRSLLILGCSQRKKSARGLLPAIDRYDGQFFRVLKKFLRQTGFCNLDVLIISARFGLIEATTPIPDYDQRMTPQRAVELAPAVHNALCDWFRNRTYHSVFINMGRVYEATTISIQQLGEAVWASGSIGRRASQMKTWLAGRISERTS